MASAHLERQARLRGRLVGDQPSAVLVTGPANIRYLTGFTGSSAQLVMAPNDTVLITDFRYAAQANDEVGAAAHVRVERINVWDGVRAVVRDLGLSRVGFDKERLTVADREQLDHATGVEWVAGRGQVGELRAIKEPAEVSAIRVATTVAAESLAAVVSTIRPGVTEIEIAASLEAALRRRGSQWHPFQTIVAAGPRSALPHARPTDRPVQSGEFLVIDFGAQVDGYCSDITRTFVVGARATEKQRHVYQVVERAQHRAIEQIRAGMTGKAADSLARDAIAREGFGEGFGHSLGHGIGLEVHEAPRLSQLNPGVLPAGAVVTVEPGVYLEGWGGVRIEDDILLLDSGAEVLSDGLTALVELT